MDPVAYPHTAACDARTRAVQAARDAWAVRWPRHCVLCEGEGRTCFHGSMDEATAVDPCAGCTDRGLCARCGQPGLDPDTVEGPCHFCHWNYDNRQPQHEECDCLWRFAAP